MTSEINFQAIRVHRGSRDGGFEELCAQLAKTDPATQDCPFVRAGQGGDAGVECYATRAAGKQTGWQSKYVFNWDGSLEAQLDKSIEAALKKRPDLDTYIVCLPFDLPAGKVSGKKSAREKWDAWRALWIGKASRPLDIQLWDASALVGRLTEAGAGNEGRIAYFFDLKVLDAARLQQAFNVAKTALGSRYTPQANVDLPIRKTFMGLARAPAIQMDILARKEAIAEACAVAAQISGHAAYAANEVARLQQATDAFSQSIAEHAFDVGAELPLMAWGTLSDAILDACISTLNAVLQLKGAGSRSIETALTALSSLVHDFHDALDGDVWSVWNARSLLLTGEAGAGKSHLLADVVAHELAEGGPSALLLGSWFSDAEPWSQAMQRLGFPASYSVQAFLAALDAAGRAAGRRALVCVDALNERRGLDIWPSNLAAFLAEAAPFEAVCVVVSCRSNFVSALDEAVDGAQGLYEVEHVGFAGTGGQAARAYLQMRGVHIDTGPGALPDFNNPLFLRTLCDYLEKRGETSLPAGIDGFSEAFDFYVEALSDGVSKALQLSPMKRVPQRGLDALADAMIVGGRNYLDYGVAAAAIEAVHASGNSVKQDLLHALASEGAVEIERPLTGGGEGDNLVRFTFERFSDHRIARRLLDSVPEGALATSFTNGGPLNAFVSLLRHEGVAAALAMQAPARFGVELLDIVDTADTVRVTEAFRLSLAARAPKTFTARTMELAERFLSVEERIRMWIAIAAVPDNAFNARKLFDWLAPLSMPERDLVWSAALVGIGFEDEVRTLIEWAFAEGLEPMDADRPELAAITLTLMLSTSHRVIRDRATLALSVLLTKRLELARSLLKRFAAFDDLYVRERLYAAVYGAAMQGAPAQPLGGLAADVWALVFADGRPPPNVLLRDHAAGIVEYAAWRGAGPDGVDLSLARPPFASDFEADLILEADLATYVQVYSDTYTGPDSVVNSIFDDDFGRYIVNPVVDMWRVSALGASPSTMKGRFKRWSERFDADATTGQSEAYKGLLDAAKAAVDTATWDKSPKREALNAARAAFRAAQGEARWEVYRQEAQNFVEHWMFSDREDFDPESKTDLIWSYRWIARRAHEMGWSAELFGRFDRNLRAGCGRHEHSVERIGKKYQWLALYELAAHLGDTRVFAGRFSSGTSASFRGADQIRLRNIDPSLLVRETYFDGWKQWPQTWWAPVEPKLRPLSAIDRLIWRDSPDDLFNHAGLIDVVEPETGERYLCLHGSAHWRQVASGKRGGLEHETWYRVYCLVTRKADEAALVKELQGRRLTAPEEEATADFGDCHLGENPWFSAIGGATGWQGPTAYGRFTVAIRAPVMEYLRENSGYDKSIDETVSVLLPAPWLVGALGLHLTDGRRLIYDNDEGGRVFFDPSVFSPGPQAALVRRQDFLDCLEREGLSAVWIVAGEKGVFSGTDHRNHFGGRALHSTVYHMQGGGLVDHPWRGHELPHRSQLKDYLGDTSLPEGFDFDALATRFARPDDENEDAAADEV